ncbi:propanediol utilization PduV domain protein [Shigella flexneri SFJ17B]|nr:propanediol utilization PduV domain protein [Shigella flexneri SFJ17B]
MGAIVARQDNFHKTSLMGRLRMEQISLVKSWLREAGAHNVLVTSAVNNNGVTELFALLHTEEGCC